MDKTQRQNSIVIEGGTITVVHFRDLLRKGRPLRLKSVHIVASKSLPSDGGQASVRDSWVNLASMTVEDSLTCEDCIFHTRFEARDARFRKTLTLKRCMFSKSLTLRGAEIGGTFDISESTIGAPDPDDEIADWKEDQKRQDIWTQEKEDQLKSGLSEPRQENPYEPPPDWRSTKWNGLDVRGSLVAKRLSVEESLNLGETKIAGTLFLQGANIGGGGRHNGRLYMRQIRVEGDLEMGVFIPPDLQRLTPEPAGFAGFSEYRTTVHGSAALGSSVIKGRLNLRGADFKGCLHAIMIQVSGRVLADCWCHPEDLEGKWAVRTTVGVMRKRGDTVEHPEAVKNISVYFQDAVLESAVWLRGIETKGGVDFEGAKFGASLELDVWHLASSREQSSSVWSPLLSSLPFGKPRNESGIFCFDEIEVDAFYQEEQRVEEPDERHNRLFRTRLGMTYHGNSLKLTNATIEAHLDMRGIYATGRICAHSAIIRGVLHCEPFQLGSSAFYVRTYIGVNWSGRSLSLYGSTIGGNVELSGAKFEGAVRMRYVTVESGAVTGNPWNPDFRPANISGQLPVTEIGISSNGHGFYLYGAKIDGNVCCRGIQMAGCLCLDLAHVRGAAEFQGSKIGDPKLLLSNAKSIADVPKAGISMQRAVISNDLDFSDSREAGPALIYMGMDATGAEITGNLKMDSAQISTAPRIEPQGFMTWEKKRQEDWHREIPKYVRGRLILAGAKIGARLDAKNLMIDSDLDAKALTVGASIDLRRSALGLDWSSKRRNELIPPRCLRMRKKRKVKDEQKVIEEWLKPEKILVLTDAMIGRDLELCSKEPPHETNDDDCAVVYGDAVFSKITIGGKAIITPYVEGKVQLDSCRVHNLTISTDASWPIARDEKSDDDTFLDLEHANVEKLDFRGSLPWDNRRQLKLEGLRFQHLDVEDFAGIQSNEKSGPMQRIPDRKRRNWIHIGVVGLAIFGFLLVALAFGVELRWPFSGHGLQNPLVFKTWHCEGPVLVLLWGLFLVASLLLCCTFFDRSRHLYLHYKSLNDRSELLRRHAAGQAGKLSSQWFLKLERLRVIPFLRETTEKAQAKNKSWRCRILLSKTKTFSLAPYMAVRSMLESQGELEHAADVHYGMRERELLEGLSNRAVKFFKWIFLVAAGSGVRVLPLVFFLVFYFLFSWLAVFSNPDSVEHPSTFVVRRNQGAVEDEWAPRTGRPYGLTWQKKEEQAKASTTPSSPPEEKSTESRELTPEPREEVQVAAAKHEESAGSAPAKAEAGGRQKPPEHEVHEWGYTDGFWMAVKIHVPLLHIWAKEKWEPSTDEGYYKSMGGMRRLPFGMEYETYAAIVQIISYLSIPMLISALTGFYKGHDHGHGGHGNGHEHHHNHGG